MSARDAAWASRWATARRVGEVEVDPAGADEGLVEGLRVVGCYKHRKVHHDTPVRPQLLGT